MSARRQIAQAALDRMLSAPETGIFSFLSPVGGRIIRTYVLADTGPVAGNAVFDVNVNGTSIWNADQTQRVKITSGGTSGEVETDDVFGIASVSRNQKITVDLDSVPSGIGSKLYFAVEIAETGAELDDLGGGYVGAQLVDRVKLSTTTGIAPSASANVYGSSTVLNPGANIAVWGPIQYIALTTNGTFGTETLDVELRFKFNSGADLTIVKSYVATQEQADAAADVAKGIKGQDPVATGQLTEITHAELFALLRTATEVTSIEVRCRSDISSSTARAGVKLAAWGGGW